MDGGFSKDGIETRSEEVQEIINRMPGWIIRYGLTLLFIIVIGLFWMTWFIRYPDIIKADITITTDPPPITLVSRTAGRLALLKQENEAVTQGELIAYIQSGTDVNDLLNLESVVRRNVTYSTICKLKDNAFNLGELHTSFNELITLAEELRLFYSNDLVSKQVASLETQIKSYYTLNKNLDFQRALEEKELYLAGEKFRTDSLLYSQRVIARQEYNASAATYLRQQRDFMNSKATIVTNTMQVQQLQKQIGELKAGKADKENQLLTNFESRKKELLARLKQWKEAYLFQSPMDGKVAYLAFLERDQFIESGSPVFTVVPNTTAVYGKVDLPISGSGKVKAHQRVNIRLDNYPSEQYGMLSGSVESISLLPKEDKYKVTIGLPNGLRSSYNKDLPFREQLQGQTEIITEDLRLTERIFYQLRKLILVE